MKNSDISKNYLSSIADLLENWIAELEDAHDEKVLSDEEYEREMESLEAIYDDVEDFRAS